jgi:hypothetical protein
MTKFPLLDSLVYFTTERISIKRKRDAGEPPPWTADPLMVQKYRFCNADVQDDAVSRAASPTRRRCSRR